MYENDPTEARPYKRSRYEDMLLPAEFDLKPPGTVAVPNRVFSKAVSSQPVDNVPVVRQATRQDIAQIIAAASATIAKPPPSTPGAHSEDLSETKGSSKGKRQLSKEEKEANKEKRLLKLIGAVVVKCMSKHQKQMDHDMFKKHAKEVGLHSLSIRHSS